MGAGRNRDDDNPNHESRYDGHRSNVDDPIFVDRLRRPGGASPIALASTDLIGRTALPIGDYPVGGQSSLLSNPARAGGAQPKTILQWSSPEGIARKGTIALMCSAPSLVAPLVTPRQWPSIYCLVTVGNARGKFTFWQVAPALVPVEATYVSVDAILAPGCGMIGPQGGQTNGSSFAQPPPFVSAQVFQATVLAQFFDNVAPKAWPTILLGPSMQQASSATDLGKMFSWPAIVKSAVFANANAAAGIWMVLCDCFSAQGGVGKNLNLGQANVIVFVPAQASVSIGEDMLGSFSNGVVAVGVTSPAGSQGTAWTEDANDANVFVTLRGQQLNFGT